MDNLWRVLTAQERVSIRGGDRRWDIATSCGHKKATSWRDLRKWLA